MPRSIGLRDDDMLGRLAEIETRLDRMESSAAERRALKRAEDPDVGMVPARDERRDTDPRAHQVMVAVEGREPGPTPPDSRGGEAQDDDVAIVDADDRTAAEDHVDEDVAAAEKRAAARKRKQSAKSGE
jgi:hypothetical protein